MKTMLWLLSILFLSGCSFTSKEQKIEKDLIVQSKINLGLAYLEDKQWERARQHLEMAAMIAPKNVRALSGLAYYLQQVGENDEANLYYLKALTYAPNDPDLQNNYGVFLCHIGQYKEAEDAFLKAIEQKGYYKLSTTYENAGLCAVKSNDMTKAKNWLKKALNHEPNRYFSTLYLLKIEMKERRFDTAKERIKSFHERYGYRASTLFSMIKLGKARAKTELVEKYAQLLAKQFPQSQEYRQYLDNEF